MKYYYFTKDIIDSIDVNLAINADYSWIHYSNNCFGLIDLKTFLSWKTNQMPLKYHKFKFTTYLRNYYWLSWSSNQNYYNY